MISRNQYKPETVSPPGQTLKEALAERGISQSEFAMRTGRPKKTISEIINGHAAITTETALQFELVLGISAGFWIARENAYREYLARNEQERKFSNESAWSKKFPISEMQKRGWIDKSDSDSDKVRELLEFYGVTTPDQWTAVAKETAIAYRMPVKFEADPYALSAWLREGIRQGNSMLCHPFDKDLFKSQLDHIRNLTTKEPDVFYNIVQPLCAEAGVAVVYVPELKKSRACGATRWLTPKKALIQLSLRYKTADQLWFTFFHEAGHILLHEKKKIFVEGKGDQSEYEREADAFASNLLIPKPAYEAFLQSNPRLSRATIEGFAAEINVHPGIVVGRLQHDRVVSYAHYNGLKARLRWVRS